MTDPSGKRPRLDASEVPGRVWCVEWRVLEVVVWQRLGWVCVTAGHSSNVVFSCVYVTEGARLHVCGLRFLQVLVDSGEVPSSGITTVVRTSKQV
jgi:hypothetical protein